MDDHRETVSLPNADSAYVERLISVVTDLGGSVLDTRSGLAGSVELIWIDFQIADATVHLTYDNYDSGTLEGPVVVLRRLQEKMR